MKQFKNLIDFIGLDYKKEITKICLTNLFLILLFSLIFIFIKPQIFVLILFPIIICIANYILFSRLTFLKRRLIRDRYNEFVSILSYFNIFISNGFNVYNSFKMTLPYCQNWNKDIITKLLEDIDKDKSVQPFINLANNFNSLIIENILISIYQMVDLGKEETAMNDFFSLYSSISTSFNKARVDDKIKSFDIMSAFPLFGAGFITIILTFGIISIIGDLVNVI